MASLLVIFFVSALAVCGNSPAQDSHPLDFKAQREGMVREQIEARGIKKKKVLDALRKVERHKFVPQQYRLQAYMDYPLPIGEGQTISQPYIVALMTDVLDLDRSKKVLEIGTGSGYQAAILAELCHTVYTIEIVESLGKKAESLLSRLGYSNVRVKIGDGYEGWKAFSPFDAIIVTCAPSHIPAPLKEQLAEGGKMVIPVGLRQTQELVLLVKEKGDVKEQAILPVRFVPMLKDGGGVY
jgi:protein-L-isoaspartate(D-aspartate) O-methyltransferase